MNRILSKITESELEILHVLWDAEKELPVAQIRKELERKSSWDSSTIKTLIRRLCEKEVVIAQKREVFYYRPAVSEKEYNDYSTQTLIDRLYQGSAKNLVASLLGNKKLRQADIDELRGMFKVGEQDE